MKKTMKWADEAQTILILELAGAWSSDEFESSLAASYELIRSHVGTVSLINNSVAYGMSPREVNMIALLRRVLYPLPSNLEMTVLVTKHPFAAMIAETMKTVSQNRIPVVAVDSLEEAYRLIAEH